VDDEKRSETDGEGLAELLISEAEFASEDGATLIEDVVSSEDDADELSKVLDTYDEEIANKLDKMDELSTFEDEKRSEAESEADGEGCKLLLSKLDTINELLSDGEAEI
jgi:hypothetical protein